MNLNQYCKLFDDNLWLIDRMFATKNIEEGIKGLFELVVSNGKEWDEVIINEDYIVWI